MTAMNLECKFDFLFCMLLLIAAKLYDDLLPEIAYYFIHSLNVFLLRYQELIANSNGSLARLEKKSK